VDPLAAFWLRNLTLRLRREICWLWHERGVVPPGDGASVEMLPPFGDRLVTALDLSRHAGAKLRFFAQDETAAYLSRLIDEPAPVLRSAAARGSFAWVARELGLSDIDCFLLALALSPTVDSAAGPVYAACLNDLARQWPTLGLAQRLWDRPEEVLSLSNPAHPLFTHGLVVPVPGASLPAWDAPLGVPALVGEALLRSRPAELPSMLEAVAPERRGLPAEADVIAARLRSTEGTGLRILPVIGPRGASLHTVAAGLASQAGRQVLELAEGTVVPPAEAWLATVLTLVWQYGSDLYLDGERWRLPENGDAHAPALPSLALPALAVTVFVGLHDRAALKHPTGVRVLPPVVVASSTYQERLHWWREHLPGQCCDHALEAAVAEGARRFRYEKATILEICRDLRSLGRPLKAEDLLRACRSDVDLGNLAQPVEPRFTASDLMLPAKQAVQLRELIQAMGMLTRVHYEWGTERAWNESGLSALFSGPPGTGKTMAAEVIASELRLPLYRIDLSQVVNKYIGETEKNLRRLFDAAEASDLVLFFDEADALFGKRTEVKDAHDRYANLEISYLLERMERFKGLAILATNRRKDLDEAFLRRLRFSIEFPLPGVEERVRIWRQVIPPKVDASSIDLDFLAQRFPLAGGHIRSIVFHACLQAAQPGGPQKLTMEAVITAVKREYDKLDRTLSLEQYGAYAALLDRLH
jgi:hypothetical protein